MRKQIADKYVSGSPNNSRNLSLHHRKSILMEKQHRQKTSSDYAKNSMNDFSKKEKLSLKLKGTPSFQINQKISPLVYLLSTNPIQSLPQPSKQFRCRSVASTLKLKNIDSIKKSVGQEVLNFSKSLGSSEGSLTQSKTFLQLKRKQNQIEVIDAIEENYNELNQNLHFENKISQKTCYQNKVQQVQKSFQSIGVSTQLPGDSFRQFMKFKITQTQTYTEMQSLFQLISKVTSKQSQNFKQRLDFLNRTYLTTDCTERGKLFAEKFNQIEATRDDIMQVFDKCEEYFENIKSTVLNNYQIEIKRLSSELFEVKKFLQLMPSLGESCEQNLIALGRPLFQSVSNKQNKKINFNVNPQKNMKTKDLNYVVCEMIDKNIQLVNQFQHRQYSTVKQVSQNLQTLRQEIWDKFVEFKEQESQKNSMINYCLDQILKLPEMSMTIFGMSNKKESGFEKELLQRLGVRLSELPQLSHLFSKPPNNECIDLGFKTLMNHKCLNCVYLKSKMGFIQQKNSQILPIMNMLNSLIRNQKKTILQKTQ